nr:unnamed protein product [Spirometra erinaceieuropaei]
MPPLVNQHWPRLHQRPLAPGRLTRSPVHNKFSHLRSEHIPSIYTAIHGPSSTVENINENKQVRRVGPKASVTNLCGSSNPDRPLYVYDNRRNRWFLPNSGAHLGIVPLTSADHRRPDPCLFPQAVNMYLNATIVTCFLPWTSVPGVSSLRCFSSLMRLVVYLVQTSSPHSISW